MYIELASRRSGKTKRIINESIKILREDKTARVAITSFTRNSVLDLDMRMTELGLSPQEYNRIYWFSVANRHWYRSYIFSDFKKVFFDEFTRMRYLMPVRNGYYVGTPESITEPIRNLIKANNGKYVRRFVSCKILKKKHEGKSKTNLSR